MPLDPVFTRDNPYAPYLCAAIEALQRYNGPTIRRSKPKVADKYLFQKTSTGKLTEADLVDFFKREEIFWAPISNLQNRNKISEILRCLVEVTQYSNISSYEVPQLWGELVSALQKIPEYNGAKLHSVSMYSLWLASPQTVIKWDRNQVAGLNLVAGKTMRCKIDNVEELTTYYKISSEYWRETAGIFRNLSKKMAPLLEGKDYPFPLYLCDRFLSIKGDELEARINNLLQFVARDQCLNTWMMDTLGQHEEWDKLRVVS